MCDQAPPDPLPPIIDDLAVVLRQVIGLYRAEAIKDRAERRCRAAVRAENAAAAR